MTTLKLSPNALGSGQFTIAAPNSNNTRTMTLSDSDGTIYIAPGDGIQALAGGIPVARTITAGTGISITNGNGVGGNPTITNSGVTSVNGSTGAVTVSTGFASGTKLLFAQTAAPTGWTKDTTSYNNYALRVVTGTASSGGSVDFTTAFASQTPSGSVSVSVSGSVGSTTLSTAQIPAHNHSIRLADGCGAGGRGVNSLGQFNGTDATMIQNTGGGGSHNHSFSGSGSGSFSGNAINLAVKYLDTILATKD